LTDWTVTENNSAFSENTNLCPSKFPNNFQKCVIKAASKGIHPFVIFISTETKKDGTILNEMRGLMFEYFLLSIKKMNMNVVFLQPSLELSFEVIMREALHLTAGIADIVVCTVPLLPLVVSGMTGAVKCFVHCTKPISRVDRFLTVFDASVWLKILILSVCTAALFWF
jgi:hypothetical protein